MSKKINAETLKARREKAGVSQWQVARELGRSQGWVSIRECGYQSVSETEAVQIATAIESLRKQTDA